ncbi:MAG: hypothetical protein IKK32_04370 [Oscillospiraceae bacterium]|nr:hypothetical protein [Oscillospiraceae bacterium]
MKNTIKKITLIATLSMLILSTTGCMAKARNVPIKEISEETVVEIKEEEIIEEEPEEIEREKTGYAEDGSKYEYFYDEEGVLISGKKYSPEGILEISFDIDGERTSNIFYNPDGTVSQTAITSSGEEVRFIEKVVFGEDNTYEHLFYNNEGNVHKRICYSENIAVSEEEFDESGRIVKFSEINEDGTYETDYQMTYDENGTSELKEHNDDGSYDIYLFDKSGRQHRVTNYNADGNEKGSIRFDYDENGNLAMTSTYDKNGNLSFYRINQYDENGELESQTKYNYDGRKYY